MIQRLLLGVLAIASSMVGGCAKPESAEAPPLEVAWSESSSIVKDDQQLCVHFEYMAWPDGGSLAIIVPFSLPEKERVAEPDHDTNCVFVSHKEGVVYKNGEVLLAFPKPDNRCYILGNDLLLHDSGRSAEWFCNAIGLTSFEEPRREVMGERGKVTIERVRPSSQRLYGELQDLWQQTKTRAFDAGWRYCPPWTKVSAGAWTDKPVANDWPFSPKWDLHRLEERPETWQSTYPRDDWSRYHDDLPAP
ncbi:MAG: hypothetical protein NTW96_23140 [Planctomycetia bacterium]|nr:hypothetical protein [Planctomycetia bacterium]